jgi:hypothetical protein
VFKNVLIIAAACAAILALESGVIDTTNWGLPSVSLPALTPGNPGSLVGDTTVLNSLDLDVFRADVNARGNTPEAARLQKEIMDNLSAKGVSVKPERVIVIDSGSADGQGHRGFQVFLSSKTDFARYRVAEHDEMYATLMSLREKFPSYHIVVQWQDSSYTHVMSAGPAHAFMDCSCPPDRYA